MRQISSSELESRLANSENLRNRFTSCVEPNPGNAVVKTIKNGHLIHSAHATLKAPSLGKALRAIIALTSLEAGSKATAEAFEVTDSHVRTLASGGDRLHKDEELTKLIESKKQSIGLSALEKTMMSFGLIDETKLQRLDAKELAEVAIKSATIFEKMQSKINSGGNVNIVIQRPPQRQEKEYQIVEVVDAEFN
jgi:hypothetical protein